MNDPGNGYDYPAPAPPSGLDVLVACEVLLRAGHTPEVMSVLMQAMPHAREMKDIARRMHAATHDQG